MAHQFNDYQSYTVYDLIEDHKFIQWTFSPDDQLEQYWTAASAQFPNLQTLIPKAKEILLAFRFEETLFAKDRENALWSKIEMAAIPVRQKAKLISLVIRSAAAAAVVAIMISVAFLYFNGSKTINSNFGEVKEIELPDGSLVTLNANSQIKFDRYWKKRNIREVWINGEALFDVRHLHKTGRVTSGDRFVVHANHVDIEVLGTTFNVDDRRGLVNVALINGSIRMGLASTPKEALILKPGDVAEYHAIQDTIIRRKTKTTAKQAWKNGKLIFDQTTTVELFSQLEDIYGYKVIIKRPEIKFKRISGTFDSRNEESLIKGIAMALGISIKRDTAHNQLIVQ